MWKNYPLGKTLILGKTESRKRRGRQMMRWLAVITDSMAMSLSKLWEMEGQGKISLWMTTTLFPYY